MMEEVLSALRCYNSLDVGWRIRAVDQAEKTASIVSPKPESPGDWLTMRIPGD